MNSHRLSERAGQSSNALSSEEGEMEIRTFTKDKMNAKVDEMVRIHKPLCNVRPRRQACSARERRSSELETNTHKGHGDNRNNTTTRPVSSQIQII